MSYQSVKVEFSWTIEYELHKVLVEYKELLRLQKQLVEKELQNANGNAKASLPS